MYNVGFGDCFLITFEYAQPVDGRNERHMLIDFGTKKRAPGGRSVAEIAKQIHKDCGGDGGLDVLVVTHRHEDHLSGFQGSAWKTISRLNPQLVIRPWTEDPDLGEDARAPNDEVGVAGVERRRKRRRGRRPPQIGPESLAYLAGLNQRHQLIEALISQVTATESIETSGLVQALGAYKEVSNRDAIANLDQWGAGGKGQYVFYGYDLAIRDLIPGIEAQVLGPPTPDQHPGIKRQVEDREDYWLTFSRNVTRVSPQALPADYSPALPRRFSPIGNDGWLVRQVQGQERRSALELVRWLDDEMNNTSVVLLLRVGKKRLLLGGDAQGESWDYTMSKDLGELAKVDLYKVGHHGSRNASPRKLIEAWSKGANKNRRIAALMSTTPGFYGEADDGTEVPRSTLVARLRDRMKDLFFTTEECPDDALFIEVACDVTKPKSAFERG
jgi:hypothetical protein